MAYVPPHKRHSNDKERPLPSPELPPRRTHFKQIPRMKSSNPNSHSQSPSTSKIIYAKKSICKWFVVGSHDDPDGGESGDDDNKLPHSLQLRPISLEFFERKFGEKPLILVDTHMHQQYEGTHPRSPWEVVASKALQDLLSSFENVRSEMQAQNSELEQVKPILVARFGKILFHGGPSIALEAMRENLDAGTMLRQFHRMLYTTLPTSYMERMKTVLPVELGLELDHAEKDLYQVKLSDANRPEATISCKCRVIKEQNKLQLHKIELNQVRQMVTDVSCLTKNLDLRLMLCTKRILTALTDDEMQCIQNLIESAVLDPNVKGGVRWPLGKASSGDRFSVIGVWHTVTNAYINPSLRLKVRTADRFDFRTSLGESASEVHLKLKGIVSVLQVQKDDIALITKMLEDTLKVIWDQFLKCDEFLG